MRCVHLKLITKTLLDKHGFCANVATGWEGKAQESSWIEHHNIRTLLDEHGF